MFLLWAIFLLEGGEITVMISVLPCRESNMRRCADFYWIEARLLA